MAKPYFKMVPAICRRACVRGHYTRAGTNKKSYLFVKTDEYDFFCIQKIQNRPNVVFCYLIVVVLNFRALKEGNIPMDTKLVIQARRHNKDAFAELIEKNQAGMYKVAAAILQNDEDVADAMQETILICWEKIGLLRHAKYFKTWMTRILIHQCYAIYNKNKSITTVEKLPDVAAEPEKYEEVEWQDMLNHLSQKQQIVVELYYGQQFKVREIADMLQIGQSAVKSRLQSARKTLEQYYFIDEGKE